LTISPFVFVPATGLADTATFPNPISGAAHRAQLMTPLNQLSDYVNAIALYINVYVAMLTATTDGASGADSVGATTPPGMTGATMQALLEELKTLVDNVVLGQIPDGTITAAKVAADVATQAELDAHTSATSNPHSVTASQAGAIANSVLTAAGDIIYASDAGTPARLAKGTDGQALTLSGGLPVWGVASLWEKIAYTVLASSAAYVDFTDISTDYDLFQIVGTDLLSADALAHEFRMRFNGDTGANYDYYASSAGADAAYISLGAGSLLASTERGSQLDLLISNVSATKRKFCNGQWSSGSAGPLTLSGRWNNTADKITSIRLYPDADSLATGCEFVLLGAKL